jgi:hypothetical protein
MDEQENKTESKSEVARLMRQITLEYEAAQRGLFGIAEGTAQHDFINRKMSRIAECHDQLCQIKGKLEGTLATAHAMNMVPDVEEQV